MIKMIKTQASFMSGLGRHNLSSLGKDLGIQDLLKEANKMSGGTIKSESFINAAKHVTKSHTLTDVGIRIGAGVAAKMIENGINSITNGGSGKTPLITSNGQTPMGKQTATYQRTSAHIGIPSTERLKRIQYNPNVDYDEKVIKSSEKDYQNHEKRKNLMIRSGFNQKCYTFLMEDTYFTAHDYLKLYKNRDKIKETLESSKTKTDIYGCVYKTKNKFKFVNKLDFYNVSMRLHMVKLYDHYKDVRELVEDITNNKFDVTKTASNLNGLTKKVKTASNNIRGKKQNKGETSNSTVTNSIEDTVENNDLINNTKTILKEAGEILKNTISEKKFRPNIKYGKILEDSQYSDPNTKDTTNRITVSFLSSIQCLLNDSIRFRDEARIVHTWERTLTPGSIWEFNLDHHLGSGIHLNQLYDFDVKNQDHPSGYFFILEQVGDRKGRIIRNKDKDFFSGYSPTQIHIEFEYKLCFLYEMKNGEEEACIYRRKKLEQDFEDNSYYEQTFTPDREPSFHVDFNKIMFNESKQSEKKEFTLEYDINLMESPGTNGLLNKLQADFEQVGINIENLTEDDKIFGKNIKNPPSNEVYEGTEGQTLGDLDL